MNNKIDQQKKCDAKSKRTGNRCQGLAMKNGKCRVHGGKSPGGVSSSVFKTGKHSKVLKGLNLSEDYEKALNDPKLLYCREEIALLDSLMLERLKKHTSGETADAWKLLKETFGVLKDVKSKLDKTRLQDNPKSKEEQDFDRAFLRLDEIIAYGLVRYSAFETVQPMLEQRRKLCETESKIIKDNEHFYPVEKAFALVVAIGSVIKHYVVEPERQQELAKELAGIVVTKERK